MAIRGGDTSALRAYNERLILNAIRQDGPMSKAEIARATGLSAQAAAVIVRELIADGLLLEQPKIRGRIGQPMTPLALNPRGAFAVGVKIGRRGVDAVLVDFLGAPVATWRASYAAPLPDPTLAQARRGALAVLSALDPAQRTRVAGLGVAMPSQIHLWAAELGLAAEALAGWESADPAATLEAATGLGATLYNDATAACAAELALGAGVITPNTLYIYLGSFVGGGVVVGGRLQHGGRGNAGAVGSMPMLPPGSGARPRQLIHEASLVFLEDALAVRGFDPVALIAGTTVHPDAEAIFAAWAEPAACAIARCAVAAASVIDFETVVLDGMLNPAWRTRLCALATACLDDFDRAGLSPFAFAEGSLGPDARVLGAAILPLHARFSPQPELLVGALPARAESDPVAAQ